MNKDIRALGLDELEQVAGGRYQYDSEEQDYYRMRVAVNKRCIQLKMEGRTDEATALHNRFKESHLKWAKAIIDARQDSPAIPLSKYLSWTETQRQWDAGTVRDH